MLDSLAPTDPILLLAVVDGPFSSLPRDVRAWFGITRENRVAFTTSTADQRSEFFKELVSNIRRPPSPSRHNNTSKKQQQQLVK